MPWIPHLMVLDDDPRVLDSLVPSLVEDLARGLGQDEAVRAMLLRGEPEATGVAPLRIKVSAHGYASDRVASYRARQPHQIHLHLVREQGGRFDLARSLLNTQLFAVVVSDLRFSDDAGGQRAGQLFVDEALRAHPELESLLYSAYPRPEGFPAARFLRKGGEDARGGPGASNLAGVMVQAVGRCLQNPAVHAFASAVADQGLIYQSDSFGTTLAQLFGLARLLGPDDGAPKGTARARRPLPTLLLDGESGTGKRGLAATLHAASSRRDAPMAVASCNELTNETLLRGILFGHKRGAFTDAREDRPGLVAAAGRGMLLLDDFQRLPATGSAILHSFLEDGEYARLGEEEIRRHAEAAVILTVETAPWAERRRSGELPLAFLARVERLPLSIPPLRDRPEDIEAQARWLTRAIAAELRVDVELADDTIEGLKNQGFAESNSRELRNVIERSIYRHARETELLTWDLVRPSLTLNPATSTPTNEWSRRLRSLAAKMLAKGLTIPATDAEELARTLFETELPAVWTAIEQARAPASTRPTIPLPVWDDLWRCYSVSRLGGPAPAEKTLGIPANTLRQWINDRESR
jgi:transcriptional regulator with AAA-type ATPase domain